MPDLLIEIGCEELPASACRDAEQQLPGLLAEALAAAGLESGGLRVHVAPRRLVAIAVTDRQAYILRMRRLTQAVARAYLAAQEGEDA